MKKKKKEEERERVKEERKKTRIREADEKRIAEVHAGKRKPLKQRNKALDLD